MYAVTRGATAYEDYSGEYWWDMDTGVLVEALFITRWSDGTTTSSLKLVETNIWEPQPYGIDQDVFPLIAAVLIAVLIIAGLLIIRKNRKPKQPANPHRNDSLPRLAPRRMNGSLFAANLLFNICLDS